MTCPSRYDSCALSSNLPLQGQGNKACNSSACTHAEMHHLSEPGVSIGVAVLRPWLCR